MLKKKGNGVYDVAKDVDTCTLWCDNMEKKRLHVTTKSNDFHV